MGTRMTSIAAPFEVKWKHSDGDLMTGVAIAIAYSTETVDDLKDLVDDAVLIVRRENGYLEAVLSDDIAPTLTSLTP